MLEPKNSPDVLDFCCGRRKCPVLRREADGSVVIADPDQVAGEIRLTREQAGVVASWLIEK